MLKSLDLCKHRITHMNKELTSGATEVDHINLDQNSISKIENISHLHSLQQLSAGHNCLIKISGLDGLRNLTVLNLPENSICSIEGVSHLNLLVWLNLSGNNIRHINGLEKNLALKHLDLSDNTVTALSDISHLYALKTLLLHGNIIRDLKDAQRFLPKNITILSLAENEVTELSQVRNLVQLKKLEQLSVMNNPCVTYQQLTHHNESYRAYVISWTGTLQVVDGQHVTPAERHNADQLLSEGVAHTFSSGDQGKLINYLSHVTFTPPVVAEQRVNTVSLRDGERPVTAGGGENASPTPVRSGGTFAIRRTKSDDKVFQVESGSEPNQGEVNPNTPLQPAASQSKSASRQSQLESSPSSSSPLVTRRDMKGLIRQVIGQERSPGANSNLRTTPKQSVALPKMSRSRSASRSPSREPRTPASRKLLLISSGDPADQSAPVLSEPELPFSNPHTPTLLTGQPKSPRESRSPSTPSTAYTERHAIAATTIQCLWRGYSTRNLDPKVDKIKHELRSRRLEDTLAFVIGELSRQQMINSEGQKIRSNLLTGIEQLSQKFQDLESSRYSEPGAV